MNPRAWVFRFAVVLGALFVPGCAFEPVGEQPFTPPPGYRALWDSAQVCTGRRGDFDRLRFFLMPGVSFDTPNGVSAAFTQGNSIWIAEAYQRHPLVVKHELVHALGIEGHPAHPFAVPCHATWASYTGPDSLP